MCCIALESKYHVEIDSSFVVKATIYNLWGLALGKKWALKGAMTS